MQKIRIADGSIVFRKEGANALTFAFRGLAIELREPAFDPRALTPLHGLSASGGLEIQELTVGGTTARTVSGHLGMARGQFELNALRFSSDTGDFVANLALDFNTIPFRYQMSLVGDPFDLNVVAGTDGGFGPAVLEFDGQGFGTRSRDLRGSGILRLRDGALPSSPVLRSLENTLGRSDLVGSPYEATEATFTLRNDRLAVDAFTLVASGLELELEGNAGLDGALWFRLVVRTSRTDLQIEDVSDEVLDSWTGDEGQIAIPFRITGTTEEPRVQLDPGTLAPPSAPRNR